MKIPYAEIERKLGYVFKNKALLEEAFTHVSYAHHTGGIHNDRMEYLGDAVLQMVVTEWQYKMDRQATAGRMTAQRQKLVCKNALDSAVDGLDIFSYLLHEGTEYNLNGKPKSSLFEAVTAAIYLDGGYHEAKQFVFRHGNLRLDGKTSNPIGDLKEYLERRGEKQAVATVEKYGKDHSPVFHCTLCAMDEEAKGEGKTIKEAQATASARLLWELKNKFGD